MPEVVIITYKDNYDVLIGSLIWDFETDIWEKLPRSQLLYIIENNTQLVTQ